MVLEKGAPSQGAPQAGTTEAAVVSAGVAVVAAVEVAVVAAAATVAVGTAGYPLTSARALQEQQWLGQQRVMTIVSLLMPCMWRPHPPSPKVERAHWPQSLQG